MGKRPDKGDRASYADHVDLRREKLKVRFFLRLSLVNKATERTRVCTIERLRDRLTQRLAFGIIDDHRRPRDGLKRQPMQAYCAAKRENCDSATDAAKHLRHQPHIADASMHRNLFQTSGITHTWLNHSALVAPDRRHGNFPSISS